MGETGALPRKKGTCGTARSFFPSRAEGGRRGPVRLRVAVEVPHFVVLILQGQDWDVRVYGKLLKDYIESFSKAIYPVGSIYMSVNATNPSTYFGGTWVAWGAGRVPVGINASDSNFNTVEKTGGAATVTLSASQIPSHTHAKGTLATASAGAHTHNLQNQKAPWGTSASNRVLVDATSATNSALSLQSFAKIL